MPKAIYNFWKQILFPSATLSPTERQRQDAMWHKQILAERNVKVEALLNELGVPENEKPARRRWEKLIADSKREMNEWDWDQAFGHFEGTGDREALYLAIFEHFTKEPRIRRERFHREALQRAKRVSRDLPPVEQREFLAKEIAIAAAHGHIANGHYDEVTQGLSGETLTARDKLYKTLVVDFFIPHLEKFRKVVQERDDFSVVEQHRYYWQPKAQLIKKVDRLLSLCRLQTKAREEEKAEWIYELYMAPKFYTEMERRPGAALEYIYWVQGPECVPEGYESPDEIRWKLEDAFKRQAQQEIDEIKESLRKQYGDTAVAAQEGRP